MTATATRAAHHQTRPDLTPQNWTGQALCTQVDPESFFPDLNDGPAEAKRICASCPVRNECLTYAITNNERHGVWGGLTERERLNLKRRNTTAPATRKDAS